MVLRHMDRAICTAITDDTTEAQPLMAQACARWVGADRSSRMPKGKGKAWVVVVVTLVELLILGVVGKFVYDWFFK